MPWIPIVHTDRQTVGVVQLTDTTPVAVYWVGRSPHDITPERWQQLLALLADAHRGSGDAWMVRCAQEAVRGLDGEPFDPVRVEAPLAAPADPVEARLQALERTDPEAAKLVRRTLEVEQAVRERLSEIGIAYTDVASLAAAIERSLSEYDRAVLATAIAADDTPAWCRAVAVRWRGGDPGAA